MEKTRRGQKTRREQLIDKLKTELKYLDTPRGKWCGGVADDIALATRHPLGKVVGAGVVTKKYDMSLSAIQERCKKYLEASNRGRDIRLNLEAIDRVLAQKRQPRTREEDEKFDAMFNALGTDGDGVITRDEATQGGASGTKRRRTKGRRTKGRRTRRSKTKRRRTKGRKTKRRRTKGRKTRRRRNKRNLTLILR